MAQEDQNYNRFGSFGNIGGISFRSAKRLKPKQKKVPQRGLGVAQLEKIRLEEQQKNDSSAIFSPPAPLSPPKSSSYLSLPIPNFNQSNRSTSSSSFPSPPPMNLSPSSSIFGPPLPVLNMAVGNSSTIPLVNQVNSGGSETGLSAISYLEQGNALKWQNSCEFYLEKENYGIDPGLTLRSNCDFPYEVTPSWPSTELMQHRAQQYQSPSPMVDVRSTTSLSSGLNFQIEPPSNQSYYYSNYSTIWADKEEKMASMKKLPLFSANNPHAPTFDHNYSSVSLPNRSNDSTSFGNGSALGKPDFWELERAPSSLTHNSASSSFENIREDEFGGNFLTLASLATRWTYPPLENLMYPDSELLSFQGGTKPTRVDGKQPFYSFFPTTAKIRQETGATTNKCNGEVEERVDLDLKL